MEADSETVEKTPMDDVEGTHAISTWSWEKFRRESLRPGGFGKFRREAWKRLLHVDDSPTVPTAESIPGETGLRRRKPPPNGVANTSLSSEMNGDAIREETKHKDEHQIRLDTDRSFVLYSVDDDSMNREEMQATLNVLITQIFRRHPKLRYFQGYHDIITVVLLTLPAEERFLCAEKLSLHRLRDSMGEGMEPMLGLLKIMKYLMRLVDPQYAALLERSTPLPYFALSNLLTLFSHDVPTVPLIQHVFDFLLSRPPIAVVYLATAVTLARRNEALEMEAEGEEGMLHSLLSQLPDLTDINEDDIDQSISQTIVEVKSDSEKIENPTPSVLSSPSNTSEDQEAKSSICLQDSVDDTVIAQSKTELSTSPFSLDDTPDSPHGEASEKTTSRSSSPSPSHASTFSSHSIRRRRPTASLPALLSHADALYSEFPPTLPALHVSEIIGPNSVVRTWSEDPAKLPSDDEVEDLATDTSLIVLPFIDPDEAAAESAAQAALERKRSKAKRKKVLTRSSALLNGILRLGLKSTIFGGVVITIAFICMLSPHAREYIRSSVLVNAWAVQPLVRVTERIMHISGWGSGR